MNLSLSNKWEYWKLNNKCWDEYSQFSVSKQSENLKTKHIKQKSTNKLFPKHSFWKILNTWFNPTGEFLGEPGNIQVIKNWQSYKYTEHQTIRIRKNIAKNHLFRQKICKVRLLGPVT